MVKRRAVIHEHHFPIDNTYMFDVQIVTSVDGGKNWYHCGHGKYCKTREEAEEYAATINEEEDV